MSDGEHWLTRWDPDDGEPYGTICDCEIGDDHNGNGDLMFPDSTARHAEEIHAEHHPGTFVPSLDSCTEHTRAEYEELVRGLPSASIPDRQAEDR